MARKGKLIVVRVDDDEYARIADAARKDNISMISTWVRKICLDLVKIRDRAEKRKQVKQ